ncbi:MAG: cbb3-type cytochrome c oxidase subunit II, partial [Lentisphaeria bacterium]|nr:cbb3-type cytochrome c oxidase subunit II [Lentisphaeria bacterium]
GGKYPDAWHYRHMEDPTSMSPGSLMPPYPWLLEDELNVNHTPAKIRAMQKMGVPYPEGYDQQAVEDLMNQANEIAYNLAIGGIDTDPDREIIALIAYLQRLGVDIKGNQ